MFEHHLSQVIMFATLCLMVMISVNSNLAQATGVSVPIEHSVRYSSNRFAPPAVIFHQPVVTWPLSPLRSNIHNFDVSPGGLAQPLSKEVTTEEFIRWHGPQRVEAVENRRQSSCSCVQLCPQPDETTSKRLQAYMNGIEALTGTIQELDEAVQQIQRPTFRECEQQILSNHRTQSMTNELVTLRSSTTPAPVSITSETGAAPTTKSSFTDPPLTVGSNRGKREGSTDSTQLSMLSSSSAPVPIQVQASEDLAKASQDLKALRKDLTNTAEWFKLTNQTMHSVMLRALQAYVTSIERRVDSQLVLYDQTRIEKQGLKSKVAVIKEKVASLVDKLKALVPSKHHGGHISRDDQGSPVGIVNPLTNLISTTTVATPSAMPPAATTARLVDTLI